MLNVEQYNALLEALPAVNADLQSKGHEIPDMFAAAPDTTTLEPPAAKAKAKAKSSSKEKTQKKKKMNIEATSDEEESESD
jgi:hypothetical protein